MKNFFHLLQTWMIRRAAAGDADVINFILYAVGANVNDVISSEFSSDGNFWFVVGGDTFDGNLHEIARKISRKFGYYPRVGLAQAVFSCSSCVTDPVYDSNKDENRPGYFLVENFLKEHFGQDCEPRFYGESSEFVISLTDEHDLRSEVRMSPEEIVTTILTVDLDETMEKIGKFVEVVSAN